MSRRPHSRPLRDHRAVVHRDADGGALVASTWESLVERLIREAQEKGRFDDLPGRGRPLPLPDDSAAGEMALAHRVLRDAGMAPPWIEADKDVRARRAEIEALLESVRRTRPVGRERLVRRLEKVADDHDDAVARLASLAPSLRQHRRPLDRDLLRKRLDEAFAER